MISASITPTNLADLLRAMFGPSLPRAKRVEECRWEDDGGALGGGAVEGYEHEWVAAT